ncbi:DNA-methyltransferase [Fodinicola acaciae]|uniref:DNA-methyltransferase n=1 Tax=Fodinicola acaciae TaxID=2681555 RepID=UPI001FE778AE|nr:site-specific DNA-methyltransferase [Fodinicola acaciae]
MSSARMSELASRVDELPRNTVLVGDAQAQLCRLPDASVDMVLTSPPYFRLRDYGVDGQFGLEPDVDTWVGMLREVMAEVARLLVPTGTLWLNLGDSYSLHQNQGAPAKSLLLAPERLAAALLADGWTLRNKVIWSKTNPMPSPVRDRLSATHEYVYVFARQKRYFFDLDAIREPHVSVTRPPRSTTATDSVPEHWRGPNSDGGSGLAKLKAAGLVGHPLGKNPGDVWRLPTVGFKGAHFATFPRALAERAIRAGCPEQRCATCYLPWQRPMLRGLGGSARRGALGPTCDCDAGIQPGLVLDPFLGSGTTALVAEQLHRDWLGIELNTDFAQLAMQRLLATRASPAA